MSAPDPVIETNRRMLLFCFRAIARGATPQEALDALERKGVWKKKDEEKADV